MLVKTVMVLGAGPGYPCRSRSGVDLTALEPVANRPIIHHALDRIGFASRGGVVFVGDTDALEEVRSSLESYQPSFAPIEYVGCSRGSGIPKVLREVEPLVRDMACLIQPADGLLDEPLAVLMDVSTRDRSDVLLLRTGGSGRGGSSSAEELTRAPGDPLNHAVDVALLAPGSLSRAADELHGEGVVDLAAAAGLLRRRGLKVDFYELEGWHRYRGHGADLLELNRMALDRLVGQVPPAIRHDNRIEGQVRIDPTAHVRASVVIGPVVIGPNATVTESYVGPYTSIGAGARIEGAEVERSIVSPGASVIHVGSRLVSSLVGRDTRVFRHFALPRAMRLWVGDGDEVALC